MIAWNQGLSRDQTSQSLRKPTLNIYWKTDTKAEAPKFWPHDVKSWLIGKYLDAGKNSGQEEKGATEDEMVGCHHRLNGHEFEQTPGDSGGQGILACCSPRGDKESDTTERINCNNKYSHGRKISNPFHNNNNKNLLKKKIRNHTF